MQNTGHQYPILVLRLLVAEPTVRCVPEKLLSSCQRLESAALGDLGIYGFMQKRIGCFTIGSEKHQKMKTVKTEKGRTKSGDL